MMAPEQDRCTIGRFDRRRKEREETGKHAWQERVLYLAAGIANL
jgi:hypothetical protein